MSDAARDYAGTELELFAGARNWKAYWAGQIAPFIRGRVLEAGAGIGTNIALLHNSNVTFWLALEPDASQAAAIQEKRDRGELPAHCTVLADTAQALRGDDRFDTILYIDVLEHIADDRGEMARAARHLAPGGHLIVLSPAHQFLFSPFDAAIGHERRYDRSMLAAVTPCGCRTVAMRMLDSAGFFLSLGNRLVTRAAMPTRGQIDLWDRVFVPVSRWLDRRTGFRFGKSILAVWRAA